MNVSATGSALAGIQAAAAQQSAATQTIASGQGDLVDGVINGKTAEVAMQVSVSMLRQAMDADKYLIDVLVQ